MKKMNILHDDEEDECDDDEDEEELFIFQNAIECESTTKQLSSDWPNALGFFNLGDCKTFFWNVSFTCDSFQ